MDAFDYIIIGGGTAGCVLAARLSEDGRRRVALVESGRDTPPGAVPDDILDPYPHRAYYNPRYHWERLVARFGEVPTSTGRNPERKYEQGRIMGGTSSINGMMAVRGLPSDFASWVSEGASGWSWDDVLPYFRKLERDTDFADWAHGRDGPMPIARLARDNWPGFSATACAAFERAGYAYHPDHNAGLDEGVFPMPVYNSGGHRVSAAIGYLDAETRKRSNLQIIPEALVEEIAFDGRCATGVTLSREGERLSLAAGEVIVSAGVMHSPGLLMRAGIGAADQLARLGIAVRSDLPGVGSNLQDHPSLAVASYIRPDARMPATLRRHIHVGVRYSSGVQDCPSGDMYILPVNQVAWHAVGRSFGTMLIWVNRSFSRGSVQLRSTNPADEALVDLNLLSDARDLERLADGVRRVVAIYRDPELAAVAPEPFGAAYSDRIRRMTAVTRGNWWLGQCGALTMALGPQIRRALVRGLVAPDGDLSEALADQSAMYAWIKRNVTHGWHGAGTCRMGGADNPAAVVDPACRVHGVERLRVIDASVMPSVVSANTSTTILMIAEKMADQIRSEGR